MYKRMILFSIFVLVVICSRPRTMSSGMGEVLATSGFAFYGQQAKRLSEGGLRIGKLEVGAAARPADSLNLAKTRAGR